MSRHHYIRSQGAESIHHNFTTMNRIEFENLYGVELLDDGGVFDPVINMYFDTFEEWVDEQVEEEEYAENEHPHQVSKKFDSEEGC